MVPRKVANHLGIFNGILAKQFIIAQRMDWHAPMRQLDINIGAVNHWRPVKMSPVTACCNDNHARIRPVQPVGSIDPAHRYC